MMCISCDSIQLLRPAMAERVGKGSLTGRWKPRTGNCPNIRGGVTIERDLPANTRLWLTGWTKTIPGASSCLSWWKSPTRPGGRAGEPFALHCR
jgi:hypothetical protein